MIVGVGNDLVDMRRINRIFKLYPHRFPKRLLSPQEQTHFLSIEFLSGRWAAKEAIAKALGWGIRNPLTFLKMSILNDKNGKLYCDFNEDTQQWLDEKGILRCHLSISHDGHYALSTAVIEGKE